MRKKLCFLGLLLAIASVAGWLVMGAHRGWTHLSETRFVKDEVTEIEYPVTRKRFKPGVDLLGAALLLSGLFVGVSFLFPKSNKSS